MSKFRVKVSDREPERGEEKNALLQSNACTAIADHTPDEYRPDSSSSEESEAGKPLLPLDD
jgi:hypothetical protein